MSKRTNIIYWTLTILFGGFMLSTSIPDILNIPEAQKFITDLGYPLYFVTFIGYAKILGVIAILIPGFPKIKEWAYAGLAFDLIGAVYSIIASGKANGQMSFMILPFGLLIASYVFYHKKIAMK